MKLHDKKILVLGATGGIGAAVVQEALAYKTRIIIAGRNDIKLRALAENTGPGPGKIIDQYRINFERDDSSYILNDINLQHPDIDIVIHALGTNAFEHYSDATDRKIDAMFQTNVFSFMKVARVFAASLSNRPMASLVVIGSTFGSIGYPGFSSYCASKFALRGYVESLRRELSHTNLEVIYIAPRAVDTALNDQNIVALNKAMKNTVDTPAFVATQVLNAIRKDRLNSFLGWPEKLFVRINAISTALVDRAIYKKIPLINQLLS